MKYDSTISPIKQCLLDRTVLKSILKKSNFDCALIFNNSGQIIGSINGEETLKWHNLIGLTLKDLLEDPSFAKDHHKLFLSINENSDDKDDVFKDKIIKIRTENNDLLKITLCVFDYLKGLPTSLGPCRVVFIAVEK